jgi:hypothetical protein
MPVQYCTAETPENIRAAICGMANDCRSFRLIVTEYVTA